MDKFKIDSHKLVYHVGRVNDWLEGKVIYPVYMEISPSGSCNHRCTYCALDFMEYAPRFLDKNILNLRLAEMGKLGVKGIMYAGEGEPLLHKDFPEIVATTKASGIDSALTTNGVLLDNSAAEALLPRLSWIKVSINAATPKTYSKIHRTRPGDFGKVISNLTYAARARRKHAYKCALGMQIILLPENAGEVYKLAKIAKDIGMDYLVVKPYSQHPQSKTSKYKDIKYDRYLPLAGKLASLNDKRFNAIFRTHTMKKWDAAERNYKHCLALPFWAYIDAAGGVWACSMYLRKDRFSLGNIYRQSFRRIWESKKRRDLVQYAAEKLDSACCRVNCRMDEVNRYLWELKNLPEHANFI